MLFIVFPVLDNPDALCRNRLIAAACRSLPAFNSRYFAKRQVLMVAKVSMDLSGSAQAGNGKACFDRR